MVLALLAPGGVRAMYQYAHTVLVLDIKSRRERASLTSLSTSSLPTPPCHFPLTLCLHVPVLEVGYTQCIYAEDAFSDSRLLPAGHATTAATFHRRRRRRRVPRQKPLAKAHIFVRHTHNGRKAACDYSIAIACCSTCSILHPLSIPQAGKAKARGAARRGKKESGCGGE